MFTFDNEKEKNNKSKTSEEHQLGYGGEENKEEEYSKREKHDKKAAGLKQLMLPERKIMVHGYYEKSYK